MNSDARKVGRYPLSSRSRNRWSFVLLLTLLTTIACTPKEQAPVDTLSESEARIISSAYDRLTTFVPSTLPESEEWDTSISLAADYIANQTALAAFHEAGLANSDNPSERAIAKQVALCRADSDSNLLKCWETWRSANRLSRSNIDIIVSTLGPWVTGEEYQRVAKLLPDSNDIPETVVMEEFEDENGNLGSRELSQADTGAMNLDDVAAAIRVRLVKAKELRRQFETNRDFVRLLTSLPREAQIWAGVVNIALPNTLETEPSKFDPTADDDLEERLAILLKNEQRRVAWNNSAEEWFEKLETSLDERLAKFGFPSAERGGARDRVQGKYMRILRGGVVASHLFSFGHAVRNCSYEGESDCVPDISDAAILNKTLRGEPDYCALEPFSTYPNQSASIDTNIRTHPLGDINKTAMFGLVSPVRVKMSVVGRPGGPTWQAGTKIAVHLSWRELLGRVEGVPVSRSREIDLGVLGTQVGATVVDCVKYSQRGESLEPVVLAPIRTWVFWPLDQSKVSVLLDELGKPSYLQLEGAALRTGDQGFSITATASIAALGGKATVSVPLDIPIAKFSGDGIQQLWQKTTERIVLATADQLGKCEGAQCDLADGTFPHVLDAFSITDLSIRGSSPLQLIVEAHSRQQPLVPFEFLMTLSTDGEWRVDDKRISDPDALLAGQAGMEGDTLIKAEQMYKNSMRQLRVAYFEKATVQDSIVHPALLGNLLSKSNVLHAVPELTLEASVTRAIVANSVMERGQAQIASMLEQDLTQAGNHIRAFASRVGRIEPTRVTEDAVSNVLKRPGDPERVIAAQAALESALLHDLEQADGHAADVSELVRKWIDQAVRIGLDAAIEEYWENDSVFSCIESTSGCPMPVLGGTGAKVAIHEYLSDNVKASFDGNCDASSSDIDDVQTRHLPFLTACPQHFGVGASELSIVRDNFVDRINAAIDGLVEENWVRYESKVKEEWSTVAKDQSPPFPETIDYIANELPSVTSSEINALARDVARFVVKAERAKLFDNATESIGIGLRLAVRTHINAWVEDAALTQDLAPAFAEVINGRPAHEILAALPNGTALIADLDRAMAAGTDLVNKRKEWLDRYRPAGVLLRSLEILETHDGVVVQGEVLPDVNTTLPIRYPTTQGIARDATRLLLASEQLELVEDTAKNVRDVLGRVQESKHRLEQAFSYKQSKLASILDAALADVYDDYVESCEDFSIAYAECRNPEELWRVLTGVPLSQWPLSILVKLDEKRGQAPEQAKIYLTVELPQRCDTLEAEALATIDPILAKAVSASCRALAKYLEAKLVTIDADCETALRKADGRACLSDLHNVVIGTFIKSLDFDSKLKSAAWNYVMSQAVVVQAGMDKIPDWALQPPAACLDEAALTVSIATPGTCGAGLVEFASREDVESYLRVYRTRLLQIKNDIESKLRNTAALCIKEGATLAEPPEVKSALDKCEGTIVNSITSAEAYIKELEQRVINGTEEKLDAALSQLCANVVRDTGLVFPEGTHCLSMSDLSNPVQVTNRFVKAAEGVIDKQAQELVGGAKKQMRALAASYGVKVVIIDGQYCVDTSFLGRAEWGLGDLQCESSIEKLQQEVENAWNKLRSIDADGMRRIAEKKLKEEALTVANRELNEACGRFRKALDASNLTFFGAPLEFELGDMPCPGKSMQATAIVRSFAGFKNIKVSAGLVYVDGHLALDWQRVATTPSIEDLLAKVIEERVPDLEVLEVGIASSGIRARIRYFPTGLPWPVMATITLSDRADLSINLAAGFDDIWRATIPAVCSEFGTYIREAKLEILSGATLEASLDDYCADHKLRALKFKVLAPFPDPIGSQPLFVVIDSQSGIKVETPDFRDLFAQNLANYLKLADIGITPANPWYTTDDGLTLHLNVILPIPVVELKAETALSISPKRIKFKAPIDIRVDQWINTSTVAFGRFGLGYDPESKKIKLSGSATLTPGELNQNIFRVDGAATFDLEQSEILLVGSSRLFTLFELSNTTTRINFKEKLFEHGVASGPLFADLIKLDGSLRIQSKSGVPFVRAKGVGELFGANITSMSMALGRQLDGEFSAYLNVLGITDYKFQFTVGRHFSNPTVTAPLLVVEIPGIVHDARIVASSTSVKVTAKIFGREVPALQVDSLDKLSAKMIEDWLEDLLKPQLGLGLPTGGIMIGGEDIEEGDGSEGGGGHEGEATNVTGEAEAVAPTAVWKYAAREIPSTRTVTKYCIKWGGLRIPCGTKDEQYKKQETEPIARGPAYELGMNFRGLQTTEARVRQIGNGPVQFAYYDHKDSKHHYVVYDQVRKKIIWQGTWGRTDGDGYCFAPNALTGEDETLPKVKPVHYVSDPDGNVLMLAPDHGAIVYAYVREGESIANAECLDSNTSNVIAKAHEVSKSGLEVIGLFDLVLKETALKNHQLHLEQIGDSVDPDALALSSEGRNYIAHFDEHSLDDSYYKLLQYEGENWPVAKAFITNNQTLIKKSLKDICSASSQDGLDHPCAYVILSSANGEAAVGVLENGRSGVDRQVTLIPDKYDSEPPLRGRLDVEGNILELLAPGTMQRQLLDNLVLGIQMKRLDMLKYGSSEGSSWFSSFLDDNAVLTARFTTDRTRDENNRPVIMTSSWKCTRDAITGAQFPVAPESFVSNPSIEIYSDLLLFPELWKHADSGWNANPAGFMKLACN